MDIGKRIKNAREKAGYSVDELAEKLGVSRATVYRYENGDIKKMPTTVLEPICSILGVTPAYLMGWEKKEKSNISAVLDSKRIRMVPVFESVSAGFGAYASNEVIDYIPLYINSDYEANETLCIRVNGNSMYPKIEDGDIIQVHKQDSVDSGSVAVVLLDGEEGLVKKVVYGEDWIELHSFNPEYQTKRFEGAEVLRLRIVGLVKKVIKEI